MGEHEESYVHNNARLCSAHFDDNAFTSTLKEKLIKGAVPINLHTADREIPSYNPVSPPQLSDAESPAGTNLLLTPSPSRRNSIKRTPKTLEIIQLRRKVTKLRKKLFKKKEEGILQKLRSKLNVDQYEFVLSQIRAGLVTPSSRRWTRADKAFAWSIYSHSAAAYMLLRQILPLPSKNTLRKSIRNVAVGDGCCPVLFNALTEQVKDMNEVDKICTLSFDEMSIKTHLSYNAMLDAVDGFESIISNDGSPQLATQSLVFMLRGIM